MSKTVTAWPALHLSSYQEQVSHTLSELLCISKRWKESSCWRHFRNENICAYICFSIAEFHFHQSSRYSTLGFVNPQMWAEFCLYSPFLTRMILEIFFWAGGESGYNKTKHGGTVELNVCMEFDKLDFQKNLSMAEEMRAGSRTTLRTSECDSMVCMLVTNDSK